MILTSRIAKNYEKIINSGNYDTDEMLYNFESAYKRNLITLEEKEYLEKLLQDKF